MSINNLETALVDEEIRPQEFGCVRFQSTWWPAKCDREMTFKVGSDMEITFKPGDAVRIVAIDNITLIVEG